MLFFFPASEYAAYMILLLSQSHQIWQINTKKFFLLLHWIEIADTENILLPVNAQEPYTRVLLYVLHVLSLSEFLLLVYLQLTPKFQLKKFFVPKTFLLFKAGTSIKRFRCLRL